ncbi:MAG: terpene cyclase/mutase family protein [Thermodesulfobacteriota bacterium]|nr:terpene cyclase/mutase family protein [Thermodesulfobacteriota bacterium]
MNTRALAFLISTQNSDGGWAYVPGQTSAVEPTAAVVMAIRESPMGDEPRRKAVHWLRSGQRPDGGWGFNRSDDESTWHTAWAVLALSASGEAQDITNRGIKWLLAVQKLHFSEEDIKTARKKLAIDLSLQGWPWLPGEAAWIEPTALTMLALKSVASTDKASLRLNEALRYIQDRRCPGGGWNVGSPIMFNLPLHARSHPTALVLLALARVSPQIIREEDVKILRSEMQRDGGSLALALGLLALCVLGYDDPSTRARLDSMQGPDGGWSHNPYHTAIALMAGRGRL